MTKEQPLEVRFVPDEEVLEHIVEKQQDVKLSHGSVQTLVTLATPQKSRRSTTEDDNDGCDDEVFSEKGYVDALCTGSQDESESATLASGSSVFTFQTVKRGNKMAQMASEWARTPGKSVTFSTSETNENSTSPTRTTRKSSTEDDEEEDDGKKSDGHPKTPSKPPAASASALYKTPSKKSKKAQESDLVQQYFEAHSSSRVLTSDRTLQRLQTPKLQRDTLLGLLGKAPPLFAEEIEQLNQKHQKNFRQWMLQLHMGFNILLYGLGSKKPLLEKFRSSMLSEFDHVVINGFFPSITLKAILNSITLELLDHEGSFRNPGEQIDFIVRTLSADPSKHVFLIIHNIDGSMLRGDKTQNTLGQLATLQNMHLLASIDHINAPLIWDHSKMSLFNWLWFESTTFLPYAEETSYENTLLLQQSGALALSSLTHVLRSLTPNARCLSFQDFYQRCRESFLVNSDITLRSQLTEFKDHKLIRAKKGADGVEYLLIPVDNTTLSDFLEKNEQD
ncbi:hypothetical protein DNTS_032597 [Danionella cerebrum]|uniref:Origin recognition complex subunit 2 n=1 Tax=Danionella cerebrum TaxID=2873325 RepID=A0A553PYA9_9TELE|nr:hypothetical protein DNTS_032597 [Danionella translucida]